MRHYQAEEFIGATKPDTKETIIEKKISLLYDFCVLTTRRGKPDEREKAVRDLLAHYRTEEQITNAVNPLIRYTKTLNEALKERGLMQ